MTPDIFPLLSFFLIPDSNAIHKQRKLKTVSNTRFGLFVELVSTASVYLKVVPTCYIYLVIYAVYYKIMYFGFLHQYCSPSTVANQTNQTSHFLWTLLLLFIIKVCLRDVVSRDRQIKWNHRFRGQFSVDLTQNMAHSTILKRTFRFLYFA